MSSRKTRYTAQDVIDALREFTDREGHQPTWEEWKAKRQSPSRSVFVRHFGGWANAIEAAGLQRKERGPQPHPQMRLPIAKVIARLERGETLTDIAPDFNITGQYLGRRISAYCKRNGATTERLPGVRSYNDREAVQMADPNR